MKTIILYTLGVLALCSLALLIHSAALGHWDAGTAYATLFVGLIAAGVIVWQGYLIKQQIAFSTYLGLDKEWNSEEMIAVRKAVRLPGSDKWDHSRLEAILEFFEKLASMYKLSGDMPFIYRSTLGWYAAQYFLFAREHGQIQYLRGLWQDNVYGDLENLYAYYLSSEVGRSDKAREEWEAKRLATEDTFWEQERKD